MQRVQGIAFCSRVGTAFGDGNGFGQNVPRITALIDKMEEAAKSSMTR